MEPAKVSSQAAADESDDHLVARAQGGDVTAFDQLIVRYNARLYGLVYHIVSRSVSVRDVSSSI